MEPPRIQAIDDVHIEARSDLREPTVVFYRDLIGLEPVEPTEGDDILVFRGAVRSGPRLRVRLIPREPEESVRREAQLLVGNLSVIADLLADNRVELEWSRGWSYYDRRLLVQDPSGNRIELVSSHPW